MQRTKTSIMTEHLHAGREIDALRIAKDFRHLGRHKRVIQQGWAAHTNPSLYRQLGNVPSLMIERAIRALHDLYPVPV